MSKFRITLIKYLVSIGVQLRQCLKSISSERAIGFDGINTKQLATWIDRAIVITIQHQKTIIAFNPAGAGSYAVGIVIEHHHRTADTNGFDAVIVQVKY